MLCDIECGLHSGFPYCCIAFYTFVWYPLFCERAPAGTSLRRWYFDWRADCDGYIRCPACKLSGRRVHPRECGAGVFDHWIMGHGAKTP